MAAPGVLTLTDLLELTKQAVGNRTAGQLDDDWYYDRINSGYSRLTTFQGLVMAPGMRRPRFRALRFFELYGDDNQTLSTGMSTNFVTPTTSDPVVYVDDVYDLTNDRPLRRHSTRHLMSRNPDDTGIPRVWSPGGRDAVGYHIWPIPGVTADQISVRERTYQYPDVLAVGGTTTPVIPAAWHKAIWLAAAAEAAQLIDWPEKAAELEQEFMKFIAERRSPVEESGAAGGRRHFNIGGI